MIGTEAPGTVANKVVALTHDWVHTFQEASGERVANETGAFSLEGASLLPVHIARPSLLVTPQIYR
ncbi:MAG TPA: hypothetical protein VFB59_03875 [Candidatus Saccharimonadales bacterium]|nr:hypothetical protein [Candidatus Saccharimonadales bacterium]